MVKPYLVMVIAITFFQPVSGMTVASEDLVAVLQFRFFQTEMRVVGYHKALEPLSVFEDGGC